MNIYLLLLFLNSLIMKPQSTNFSENYLLLSRQLLQAARQKTDAEAIQQKLAVVSLEELADFLDNDRKRKAFWINLYNANIQLILSRSPELFNNRNNFFTRKQVKVAQRLISFDDIEHGIIRGSRIKLSLGLIKNPFPGKYEKKLRVKKLDPRIHFALNCGAKSCPPVAIYEASKLDRQLDTMAKLFLQKTSEYDPQKNLVQITSLFSWFRGDFGLKSGTREMLKTYNIIPEDADPQIKYADYDWTLSLGNYVDL